MSNTPPYFSIVIPTHGRIRQITACLESLTRLQYPRDRYQVIVVDDGTVPPVEPSVRHFGEYLNLLVLRQEQAGPATARNNGAAHAAGEYLAFTDDDCTPAPDWLQALADQFGQCPNDMIGGQTLNDMPDNAFTTASQLLISYLYDYYNAEPDSARFLTSNNMALSKILFDQIGGFDGLYPRAAAEDREFCDRWLHCGYRITYAPRAIIRHGHKLTLRSFWRQHFAYGSGAFHFHRVRARRQQKAMKVEPLSFYLNLVRYPLRNSRRPGGLWLAGLMALSQIANIAGYFCERFKHMNK